MPTGEEMHFHYSMASNRMADMLMKLSVEIKCMTDEITCLTETMKELNACRTVKRLLMLLIYSLVLHLLDM